MSSIATVRAHGRHAPGGGRAPKKPAAAGGDKKKEDKKDGKATTYTNRITMVVVLDACCKYPIGYAIGLHESPALIREALDIQ